MSKVYIDCGHGGTDSGAVNRSRNVLEKNISLELGKLVEAKLKVCGVDVKLSRTSDISKSLSARTSEANSWGANALVSIHVNDATKEDGNGNKIPDPDAQGLETFCYKFVYKELATCIQNELVSANLYNKNRGVKEGNLHMVRESKMAAALVETFFINNNKDLDLMLNNKDRFATAIAKGICKFLKIPYVEGGGGGSVPSGQQFPNGEYQGRKARVLASSLNVRYDRWIDDNPEPKIIGTVTQGQIVDLGYCLKGWVALQNFSGNKGFGYVNSKYLELI